MRMFTTYIPIYCTVLIALSILSHAQKDEGTLETMSLEELLDTDIRIASVKFTSLEESPSIVSLITREEILQSGARDLTDILRLIPGFHLGLDVQNALGIGLRGNWAHEGKILVQIDGNPINDILYGNPVIGNRIEVDNIERIEIIRGPGSVQYGGFAGLGVINVITRTTKESASISAKTGIMSEGGLRQTVTANLNTKVLGFDVYMNGNLRYGVQSDYELYAHAYNDTLLERQLYSSKEQQKFSSYSLYMQAVHNNFSFGIMSEKFGIASPINGVSMMTNFSLFNAHADFTLQTDAFTFTPRIIFQRQFPWETIDNTAKENDSYFSYEVQRFTVSLPAVIPVVDNFLVSTGLESWIDRGLSTSNDSAYWFDADRKATRTVDYVNIAGYAMGEWTTKFVNLAFGFRLEHNSAFGSAFVPRFAATKVWGDFHLKAMASRSFRAPTIMNITAALQSIKPEFTSSYELEFGYRLSNNFLWTANGFIHTLDNPIVFRNTSIVGAYINGNRSGTYGIESELRFKQSHLNGWCNYSYYRALHNREISYQPAFIPESQYLAFPSHKIAFLLAYSLLPTLTITPSFQYSSTYYGFADIKDNILQNSVQEFPAYFLSTIALQWNLPVNNLSVSLSCHNLTNEKVFYPQPYISDANDLSQLVPAVPGPTREFVLRVLYSPDL